MEALPQNASEEDTQWHWQLAKTMLESYLDEPGTTEDDPPAQDFKLNMADAEKRLQKLQGRPANPITNMNGLSAPGSRASHALPSRERDYSIMRPPTASSPTAAPPDWSTAGLGTKRARNSLLGPSEEEPAKRSRTNSEAPSTTASTPGSLDSFDRAERDIEARHRSQTPSGSVLAKYQEEQRKALERYAKEQRDRELAQSFSQGRAAPSFGQTSAFGKQKAQAYFGTDGRLAKPSPLAPPARVQNLEQPQRPSYEASLPIKKEHTPDLNGYPVTPSSSYRNRPSQPGSSRHAPIDLDDEDDGEVQMVFSRDRRPYPSVYQGYEPAASRQLPPLPTLLSNGHAASQSAWQQGMAPHPTVNPMAGGSSVYDTLRSGISTAYNHFSGLLQSGVGAYPSNPISVEDGPYRRPDLEESLRARGLENMLNDPAQSREELENLIENIRPDEEIPREMRINSPDELKCVLMEHQKLGLAWLQKQEASPAKGGILADDMGLGKTIQALALIATRRSRDPACKTTLIVAPVALLRQWKREVQDRVHPQHKLSSFIYHGQQKNITFAKLNSYDIVLTTYGKLAAEYKRKTQFEDRKAIDRNAQLRPSERLVLLDDRSRFHRIIVDEAQNIKNHNTKSAMGALYLQATYRLCMTGTPMMNSVAELYSLIRFLRIPPYNSQEQFNTTFKRPLASGYPPERERAMQKLQGLLKSIMLRRTKDSKIDGRPILNLPPRTTEVATAIFESEQETLYRALEQQTQLEMNKYLQKGKKLTNYSYVLVRLLRLRQACDHPHLISDLSGEAYSDVTPEIMEDLCKKLAPDVINRIKEADGAFECPICYDAVENPSIFFPCGHDCCPDCFVRVTDPTINPEQGHGAKCPECRQPLDTKKIIDYRTFKKVFQPEAGIVNGIKAEDEEEEAKEVDSDTDDDSDPEESDVDSQGNLDGFVVDDDEEIRGEDDESDPAEGGDDDEERECVPSVSGSRAKGKQKASSSKTRSKKNKKDTKGKGKRKDKKKLTLAQLRAMSLRNLDLRKKYLKRLRKNYESSAKIEKTMSIVNEVHNNDPAEKIIIFSQFTSFLDLLELPITDAQYKYRRYDGSMSATMRNEAVMDFQDSRMGVKIMLVSLKAGNAGLNLTAASQVIILDPFWNPFIEEQAVDRAHRIGQMRPVNVHKMLVENTVEDRIVALQEKKRELITTALDEKAGQSLSRLGREELRYLFGLGGQP